MYVLGGLGEDCDNVFLIITKKMLREKGKIDNANDPLLSYESRIERRKVILVSPLPSVNLSVKGGIDSTLGKSYD